MFSGSLVEATCGRETTLIRQWRCSCRWEIRSLLGFSHWHRVSSPPRLNGLNPTWLFWPVSWHTIRGEHNYKGVLEERRALVVYQMGIIMAFRTNPWLDSSIVCPLASTSYVWAHTSPNKHTPRAGGLHSTPLFQEPVAWSLYIRKL